MQRWEYFRLVIHLEKDKWWIKYKDTKTPYDQIISVLNELGNQGWEFTTSTSFVNWESKRGFTDVSGYAIYTDTYIYTFKRPKS